MGYTLYEATVLTAKNALESLHHILTVAQTYPESDSFLDARITDDMLPLSFQAQYAAYQALCIISEISGDEMPPYEGKHNSYKDIQEEIRFVIAQLESTDKEAVNQMGMNKTTIEVHGKTLEVSVQAIVCSKIMPNINFHVVMAYAILRMKGVALGKRDYSRYFIDTSL